MVSNYLLFIILILPLCNSEIYLDKSEIDQEALDWSSTDSKTVPAFIETNEDTTTALRNIRLEDQDWGYDSDSVSEDSKENEEVNIITKRLLLKKLRGARHYNNNYRNKIRFKSKRLPTAPSVPTRPNTNANTGTTNTGNTNANTGSTNNNGNSNTNANNNGDNTNNNDAEEGYSLPSTTEEINNIPNSLNFAPPTTIPTLSSMTNNMIPTTTLPIPIQPPPSPIPMYYVPQSFIQQDANSNSNSNSFPRFQQVNTNNNQPMPNSFYPVPPAAPIQTVGTELNTQQQQSNPSTLSYPFAT